MIYRTPGVYVEEIPALAPTVAEVETAIPAFIGYTEKSEIDGAPTVDPIKISSIDDYVKYFGGAPLEGNADANASKNSFEIILNEIRSDPKEPKTFKRYDVTAKPTNTKPFILYYALQLYFANGGGKCYVVSADVYTKKDGDKPVTYNTINGDKLIAGIEKIASIDEPTLLVIPEATSDGSIYKTVYEAALTQCKNLGDRFTIIDMFYDEAEATNDLNLFRGKIPTDLEMKKYGAAYYPYLKTLINYNFDVDKLEINTTQINGTVDDIKDSEDNVLKGKALDSLKGSLLYNQIKSKVEAQLIVTLPPSPAVAGIYCRVDRDRGVWKAPANVSLMSVSAPDIILNNEQQQEFNYDATTGKSVNVIRSFSGRGIILWGARTLAGNDNEWRYVNVRRFFNMVEESVQKSTLGAVFEPNTKNTWVMVKAMIENYLITKWKEGALAGAKPEEAFYVRVGLGETMTEDEINNGYMNVEIGMAVARPAEFIVLKFSHKMQGS